jgi:cytochrome c oxidase subunit 2
VIHAWWVPALAIKKDAVPGMVNEMWFRAEEIGTYRGQCAELCGKDHGYMPIVVEVVATDEFAQWMAASGGKSAALAASH